MAKSVGAGAAVDFRAVQVSSSPMGVPADGHGGRRSDYETNAVDDVVDGRVHVLSMVARRRGSPAGTVGAGSSS